MCGNNVLHCSRCTKNNKQQQTLQSCDFIQISFGKILNLENPYIQSSINTSGVTNYQYKYINVKIILDVHFSCYWIKTHSNVPNCFPCSSLIFPRNISVCDFSLQPHIQCIFIHVKTCNWMLTII